MPLTNPQDLIDFYKEPIERQKRQKLEKERRDEMSLIELTEAEIAAVRAESRTRGIYTQTLDTVGDSHGKQVDFENGDFAGKKFDSVMQGFRNATKKDTYKHIQVVTTTNPDESKNLYLINSAWVAPDSAAAAKNGK